MRTEKITEFYEPSFRTILDDAERLPTGQKDMVPFNPWAVLAQVQRFHSLVTSLCMFGPEKAELYASSLASSLGGELDGKLFKAPDLADKLRRTKRVEIRLSHNRPSRRGFSINTINVKGLFFERSRSTLILFDMDLRARDGQVLVCTLTTTI